MSALLTAPAYEHGINKTVLGTGTADSHPQSINQDPYSPSYPFPRFLHAMSLASMITLFFTISQPLMEAHLASQLQQYFQGGCRRHRWSGSTRSSSGPHGWQPGSRPGPTPDAEGQLLVIGWEKWLFRHAALGRVLFFTFGLRRHLRFL